MYICVWEREENLCPHPWKERKRRLREKFVSLPVGWPNSDVLQREPTAIDLSGFHASPVVKRKLWLSCGHARWAEGRWQPLRWQAWRGAATTAEHGEHLEDIHLSWIADPDHVIQRRCDTYVRFCSCRSFCSKLILLMQWTYTFVCCCCFF